MAHCPMALWHYGLVALLSIYGHYAFSVVCSPCAGTQHRSQQYSLVSRSVELCCRPCAPMLIMDSSTELELSSYSDGTDSDYGTASFLDNR